ncbi:hypothetical protein ISU82_14765 [Leptospira borgpetersenii serovar Balcanica]|nr:hypothetical protein [Leptospira borgpetersenii]MBE8365162.1 hypothetical protein [Leptospira borgpetersenii serovar Balcanica]MBE8366731.1 hypothetical protein [Leptospira borgpetersenii serovar Balcanica]MBE8424214.1 hypothetical protein [Leptospira borgpetersenii serovar Balcanica]MBF3351325.1 hypothetical protein [Leptospira borgpetersenii serovar Balcanica]
MSLGRNIELKRDPKPHSLLCQKDQAARFCSSFGTEPYIEFTFLNRRKNFFALFIPFFQT